MKYACIARYRDAYAIRLMCRVLHVAPAGFYAAQRRPASAPARRDGVLRLHVRATHAMSTGTYGAPRIARALATAGIACGRHRVARLLRAEGLQGVATRAFHPPTTQADAGHPVAPNVLARRFAVGPLQAEGPALNQRWAADMTYLPTRAGWLYLAVVLDLASRRVVGWPRIRRSRTRSPWPPWPWPCVIAVRRAGRCTTRIVGGSTPVRRTALRSRRPASQ